MKTFFQPFQLNFNRLSVDQFFSGAIYDSFINIIFQEARARYVSMSGYVQYIDCIVASL